MVFFSFSLFQQAERERVRASWANAHSTHTPNADQTSSTAAVVRQIRLPRASTTPKPRHPETPFLAVPKPPPGKRPQRKKYPVPLFERKCHAVAPLLFLYNFVALKSHFCTLPILGPVLALLWRGGKEGGGGKNRKQTSPRRNNPQRRDRGCSTPAQTR